MTRFGKLTLLETVGSDRVSVKCDCGTLKVVWLSNLRAGRTKSCGGCTRKSLRQRFDSLWALQPNSDCWLWIGGQRSNGYGSFRIGSMTDHSRRIESAHRVAWMILVGEIPKGMCVLHHCDTPLCVNPQHLFLGTLVDNNQDMTRKGRLWKRGAFIDMATREAIELDLRPQRQIAKDFAVSQTEVSKIKRGTDWIGRRI